MSGFFVLDVPEFSALTHAATQAENCVVHPSVGGYRFVQFSGALSINRADTGLSEAVWFGCLTGGLDGKIDTFDKDVIRLMETNEPI